MHQSVLAPFIKLLSSGIHERAGPKPNACMAGRGGRAVVRQHAPVRGVLRGGPRSDHAPFVGRRGSGALVRGWHRFLKVGARRVMVRLRMRQHDNGGLSGGGANTRSCKVRSWRSAAPSPMCCGSAVQTAAGPGPAYESE